MQALIDFDGWRKWKDFSSIKTPGNDSSTPSKKAANGATAGNVRSPKSLPMSAKSKKTFGMLDGGTSSSGEGLGDAGGASSGEGG